MRSVLGLALVGLALVTFGCGGDSGTTPTPISYDGTWSGTTSQGFPFTLVVANNAVTQLTWQLQSNSADGSCGGESGDTSAVSPPAVISNGSFSAQLRHVTATHDLTITWTGTFASATSASGTTTSTGSYGGGACVVSASATWTASK